MYITRTVIAVIGAIGILIGLIMLILCIAAGQADNRIGDKNEAK